MGNGPTNQDEIKIKRGAVDRERQLALMNNICPRHSLNQIILPLPGLYLRAYLSLPVTVPVISPSLPLVFFFFFSLSLSPALTPPLLCDCWSPKRDRGMLQEYESNRCLITVLIAGHGETHARVHSDEQRQRWELLHSPHIPALLSVIISWLNYQAWIIPTCRCLEPASILRCVPTRLPPNSQISHLTPMQDLLESWSCKLWKGVFFFPPSTHIFFFLGGGGINSNSSPILQPHWKRSQRRNGLHR